jgi:hypothetical protein
MGRPSIGDRPMTPAERQRRRRDRLKDDAELLALVRVWKRCSKRQRTRFLRALRAEAMLLKNARRDAKWQQIVERTARQNATVFVIRAGGPPAPPARRPRPSAFILQHRARVAAREAALRADAALLS